VSCRSAQLAHGAAAVGQSFSRWAKCSLAHPLPPHPLCCTSLSVPLPLPFQVDVKTTKKAIIEGQCKCFSFFGRKWPFGAPFLFLILPSMCIGATGKGQAASCLVPFSVVCAFLKDSKGRMKGCSRTAQQVQYGTARVQAGPPLLPLHCPGTAVSALACLTVTNPDFLPVLLCSPQASGKTGLPQCASGCWTTR